MAYTMAIPAIDVIPISPVKYFQAFAGLRSEKIDFERGSKKINPEALQTAVEAILLNREFGF